MVVLRQWVATEQVLSFDGSILFVNDELGTLLAADPAPPGLSGLLGLEVPGSTYSSASSDIPAAIGTWDNMVRFLSHV
jgi:hypothetical protein